MRPGIAVVLSIASAASGVGLVACFDLFHSTGDVKTACEIDPATPGCPATSGLDASSSGGTDFCAWPADVVRQHAEHACAWLGACETPLGRNAFGSCMFEALLAYDCAANPGHRSKGKAHALWDCLWRAQGCADVDACVFPKGTQGCESPGDYTACASASSPTANNFDVRIECVDGGTQPLPNAHGENCALWGQTCATDGTLGACAGSQSGLECTQSGCFGASASELHWCVDGGDVGIDCASNGSQRCGGFPTASSALWVACIAESDAAACEADASATCSAGGVATSCPSGVPETLDCQRLLQSPQACTAGPLSPPFDWTGPCAVVPAQCSGDSCAGSTLTGCARGAAFTVDCAGQGLGACRMLATDVGAAQHGACAPM